MHFSLFALVALAVSAVATPAKLLPRADSTIIMQDIQVITQKSSALNDMVENLSIVNVFIQGPQVAPGLQDIVETGGMAVNDVTSPPQQPFANADAVEIINVLKEFVVVHQMLLNTLIGKHGLLTLVPFVGPAVAAALRSIEEVVDTFAFALLDLIPTQAGPAVMQMNLLDESLNGTIAVYTS
ncbi:hypothetical protein EXIGLDRAFT_755481 [Exidia glandulosa HHB12029]|uniref:FAS1 domain-containing protein n=1 Tax=Exidia glandulosa HHB12029 TaxID=1314781 RepID=A0A165ZD63_EXIGL|nr:hypothetical protein EXIGLDRAFT_755481 [Exidia glandulosa HHB12029]